MTKWSIDGRPAIRRGARATKVSDAVNSMVSGQSDLPSLCVVSITIPAGTAPSRAMIQGLGDRVSGDLAGPTMMVVGDQGATDVLDLGDRSGQAPR